MDRHTPKNGPIRICLETPKTASEILATSYYMGLLCTTRNGRPRMEWRGDRRGSAEVWPPLGERSNVWCRRSAKKKQRGAWNAILTRLHRSSCQNASPSMETGRKDLGGLGGKSLSRSCFKTTHFLFREQQTILSLLFAHRSEHEHLP